MSETLQQIVDEPISQSETEKLHLLVRELEIELAVVKTRNSRVELEKKWETSSTRFLCVTAITYLMMNLILWTIGGPFPPVHAIVPTCGYMLSTLSLPKLKNLWMRRQRQQDGERK